MTFIRPTDDLHSADLVQRLRTPGSVRSWEEADKQRAEAADRIEQLERENKELRAAETWAQDIAELEADRSNDGQV